jgi:hypothetical protein
VAWNAVWERPRQGKLAARLSLTARAGAEPQIAGSVGISDAVFHFSSALHEPIVVSSARLEVSNNGVEANSIDAALGPLKLRGSLAADWARASVPSDGSHSPISALTFRLEAPEIDLQQLSSLLPAPPQPKAFSWFGEEQPVFPSLAGWPAMRGTLATPSLRYGGLEWNDVVASISLYDQQVEISEFSSTLAGGTQHGSATISLGMGRPGFALETRYTNLELEKLTAAWAQWTGLFSGKMSGNLTLSASGRRWHDILSDWTGNGQATGRSITIHGMDLTRSSESEPASPTRLAFFSSAFQIAKQQLHLTEMTATSAPSGHETGRQTPPSVWRISGMVGFDRSVDLTVQPAGGQGLSSQVTGTLLQPRIARNPVLANATAPEASPASE